MFTDIGTKFGRKALIASTQYTQVFILGDIKTDQRSAQYSVVSTLDLTPAKLLHTLE